MNATSIIVIAVAVVVVLGMIAFVTMARRSDVRGAGALSAETRRRDRAATCRAVRSRPVPATRPRPRPRAWSPAPARRSCAVEPAPLAPWVPPDPEAIGVSRRHVLQPRHDRADDRRHRHVRGGELRGVPLAVPDRRLRRQGAGRQARRHQGGHHRRQRLLLRARGTHLDHGLPGRRDPEGRGGLLRARCSPACARASSRCTRSARTSAAASRTASAASGSNARATARSTTASARRRPAPHRVAWTTSRVTVAGNGDVTVDTGDRRHRSADRHQHHRPGGRGPALHRAVGALMPALATTSIAWVLLAIMRGRLDRLRRRSTPARRGASSARRSSSRANRKPYFDDEELEGRRLERVQLLGLRHARDHRHRPAAVLDPRAGRGWPAPPRAGGAVRRLGRRAVRADGATAASTAPAATAG